MHTCKCIHVNAYKEPRYKKPLYSHANDTAHVSTILLPLLQAAFYEVLQ
jgi:hypothetical protein